MPPPKFTITKATHITPPSHETQSSGYDQASLALDNMLSMFNHYASSIGYNPAAARSPANWDALRSTINMFSEPSSFYSVRRGLFRPSRPCNPFFKVNELSNYYQIREYNWDAITYDFAMIICQICYGDQTAINSMMAAIKSAVQTAASYTSPADGYGSNYILFTKHVTTIYQGNPYLMILNATLDLESVLFGGTPFPFAQIWYDSVLFGFSTENYKMLADNAKGEIRPFESVFKWLTTPDGSFQTNICI